MFRLLVAFAIVIGFADVTRAEEPTSPALCDSGLLDLLKGVLPVGEWGELVTLMNASSKLGGTGQEAAGAAATAGETALGVAGGAKLLFDALQSLIIADGIRINFVTPDNQITHFGPVGHEAVLGVPGEPLRFTLHVGMTLTLPDQVIACAEQVGYKLPKPGPIAGVRVIWGTELLSESSESYGTVAYEPADERTDNDGNATLIFTPASELDRWGVSGIGKEENVSGSLLADPLVLSALGMEAPPPTHRNFSGA